MTSLRTALTAHRTRVAARRAHARWVNEKLAEIDVSRLDRLDRWLAS